ncbi:MAG: hypothetical protein JWM34_3277 [Ilumatobacteraceae bacterium]|nr:hypothetical protein [Ilumatobacteraceae bacterium]
MSFPARYIPAVVGVAQVVQRPDEHELGEGLGPIELMVEAARQAEVDSGVTGLLERVGFVGVAGGWFRYLNPGQLVAERIGAPSARTALSAVSGTGPQDLVALACERIALGELDVAMVVGGEARWSHQRLKRQGRQPAWVTEPGVGEPEHVSGFPNEMIAEAEQLGSAAAFYALFEDRLRSARHESSADHSRRLGELWSRFSNVAAKNPHAWDTVQRSALDVVTPSGENRMIVSPYTKAMVANNTVDMGSALLLCSAEAARAARIPAAKLVYPHVITNAHETWLVAQRDELHRCPALEAAGVAAFERVGISPSEVAHIDLYACFPSIVQMSCDALGIDPSRQLTVTGGLGFAGAPVGNSVGHSIAAITELVRTGGWGLVHGNGGHATKQSFGIYSSEPPDAFAHIDVQDSVDLRPRAVRSAHTDGRATLEAATVVFDREGPSHVLASVVDDKTARGWATSNDPDLIGQTLGGALAGLPVRCLVDGTFVLT